MSLSISWRQAQLSVFPKRLKTPSLRAQPPSHREHKLSNQLLEASSSKRFPLARKYRWLRFVDKCVSDAHLIRVLVFNSDDEDEGPAAKKQKTLSEKSVNSGEADPSAADKTPQGAEAAREPTAEAAAAAPTPQKVLGKRKAKGTAAPGASSSPPDHVSDVFFYFGEEFHFSVPE